MEINYLDNSLLTKGLVSFVEYLLGLSGAIGVAVSIDDLARHGRYGEVCSSCTVVQSVSHISQFGYSYSVIQIRLEDGSAIYYTRSLSSGIIDIFYANRECNMYYYRPLWNAFFKEEFTHTIDNVLYSGNLFHLFPDRPSFIPLEDLDYITYEE